MCRLLQGALALAAVAVMAPGHIVAGQATRIGDITVTHAWARASLGQAKAGAVYMTLASHGRDAEHLVGASSPVAARASVHRSVMRDGVMTMEPRARLEVAPGKPTMLQPGGLHVMLMGLDRPLRKGETFSLTLEFARSGKGTVSVHVKSETVTGHGHRD